MTRQELIDKTTVHVNSLDKIKPSVGDVDLCKKLHDNRLDNKEIWNSKHPLSKAKESKISRNHDDGDLWWGLLGELEIARIYGSDEIVKSWYYDQLRQNHKVMTTGVYDCKDIGNTQVRAAEWDATAPRRVIYRPNDFRTKSTQPVIACVINTDPNDLWMVVCGFMSWEDLKRRKEEFWCDPDNRGFAAMFIPYWELTPMDKFKSGWLKE